MRALLVAAGLLAALVPATVPAAAQMVPSVRAIEGRAPQFTVNAVPAVTLDIGTYKTVLVHPKDPESLVKVFDGRWSDPAQEQKRELSDIARLPEYATPSVRQWGEAGGKPFIVVDRVNGLNMRRPTPLKLEETRKLFERLAKAGLKMGDVESLLKLQQNIVVGETRGWNFRAWLVDPELEPGTFKKAELETFYDGLSRRLAAGR